MRNCHQTLTLLHGGNPPSRGSFVSSPLRKAVRPRAVLLKRHWPKRLAALACALLFLNGNVPAPLAAAKISGQGARVAGVVLDDAGESIAGAEVALSVRAIVVAQATTGADGRFAFDAVSIDDATLRVRASGFAEIEQKLNSKGYDTGELRIVLAPAPLTADVTVTATRTETRTGDTPASIVTLAAAELSSTGAITLDDALRQVPGFQLFRRSGSRSANPTSQGVSLRGTGASGASRAVVLLDGIPLNDPFGGWVVWGRVPREAVGRVEVVRGGASHLYGSDALGGVIQIITRNTDAPALALEMSYGNGRTPDASLFAGGRKGRWGATLAVETFRTDGYVLVDERERGAVDTRAGSRRAALDVMLERRMMKDARVFVRASSFGESRTNGTPLQTNRTHIRQLGAGGDWQSSDFGDFNVRAYSASQVYDQNFTAIAADRNSESLTRVQRVPAQAFGFAAQWSRVAGASHTLVAGLDAREVRGASDEIAFVQNRASSLIGAGGRERAAGFFVEDIFRVNPKIFITGSARFDRWRNYAASSATRALRAPGATVVNAFADRTETAFSPHLSVLYKPTEKASLFASAYRAFRAPTLNELYRSFRVGDVLTLANENLRAERLTGGEAGINLNWPKRKFNVRAVGYWTEITRPVANVTLSIAPALITRQRQNLGRTRSRGLELEAEARPTNRVTVSGGYALADASVISFPVNTSLEGLRIPQVARHQFTFQTRYATPARGVFALQGRAASSQFDDDQNRLRLNRYFVLDAFASYPLTRGVEIIAAVENVFNRRYEIGRTPVTTLGPPALLRFGLRLHLGAR